MSCDEQTGCSIATVRAENLSMWTFIAIIFYAWVSEVIDIHTFINPEVLAIVSKKKKTTQFFEILL